MTTRTFIPFTAAVALLAASFSAGTGIAADAAATTNAPPKKKWETVASAGATLTRGNSKTFLANVDINSKRKWSRDELLLGASAGYGENETGTRAPTGS